jgi:acetoin utilization protein AcuB
MSVKSIISYEIPTILPTDTGDTALRLMEENNLEEIPVVGDGQYLALIRHSDMLEWDTPEESLTTTDYLRYSPAVFVGGHAYDALRMAYSQHLSVLPVIDEQNKYLGAATHETLINYLAENSGIDTPGGVLILEVNPLDYSLYEIARICESEDVAIITTHLFTNRVSNKLELTIKTNRSNLESLASTYERFGYTVKEMYGERSNKDDMMDRYNLLMAYINM